MTPSRLAAALCVLGALLVPASARSAQPASVLPFSDWLHAAKAGPSSRAKPMSDYERAETKHICLQETRQYNCRYVGCPDVNLYSDPDKNGECIDQGFDMCKACRHNTVYQSDLTCCNTDKPYAYGGYGGDEGGFGSGVAAPTLKVGTCDWDISLYSPISLETPAKTGTAWATCYLTAGADYCGGELCDNVVLSFRGVVHQAVVRSTLDADLATSEPDSSCLTCLDFNPSVWYRPGCDPPLSEVTSPYFVAYIITGPVSLTSLDRQLEFTRGHMEYVPYALKVDEDFVSSYFIGSLPPLESLSLVTPNTYNIKLVGKMPKGSYY